MNELQAYVRINFVDAAPMTRGEYNKFRDRENAQNENLNEEGYILYYRKGTPKEYIAWCPKDEFDRVSHSSDEMTFGEAIEALKQGKKVARKGWNGKGMFLWLNPQMQLVNDEKSPEAPFVGGATSNEPVILATICMQTVNGDVLVGWLASQTDMLSNDWVIVE